MSHYCTCGEHQMGARDLHFKPLWLVTAFLNRLHGCRFLVVIPLCRAFHLRRSLGTRALDHLHSPPRYEPHANVSHLTHRIWKVIEFNAVDLEIPCLSTISVSLCRLDDKR